MAPAVPFPLEIPVHVHKFAFREDIHLHFLADFVVRQVDAADLADEALGRRARFLRVAGFRLVGRFFFLIEITQLDRFVTVAFFLLFLEHDVRRCLHHRHRNHGAFGGENLGHADFASQNPFHDDTSFPFPSLGR